MCQFASHLLACLAILGGAVTVIVGVVMIKDNPETKLTTGVVCIIVGALVLGLGIWFFNRVREASARASG